MQTLTVGVMSDEAPRKEVNKGYHKDAWLTLAQKIEENVDQAARLFLRGVLLDHRFTRTAAHVPPSDRTAWGLCAMSGKRGCR
jgi:hypothetical protein